ncbi:pyruvate kinase-like isoform X1 [Ostrinia nubilalis]|uniref:pyruvate kinase-like isoform X1 n=1 Tax=Ostrinia nubilalis TaxID=29057 RepID=UPI0030824A89
MALLPKTSELEFQQKVLHQKRIEKPYRLTPYIVTICEGTISEIDIRNFLEAGLRIVRFKMTHIARKDKVVLLSNLRKAITWCCDKYEQSTWPVAVSIDLPNACIRTGYLKDEINKNRIFLEEGKIIEVTAEVKYWNQCDEKRMFIDDPFTLETVKPNTEISINFGAITMICTEVINPISIKCKIVSGGYLSHAQFVCIRGTRLLRPTLSRLDKQLLAFVKEYELDVITVHSIRTAKTLGKVRAFFKGCHMPMIISTICEQEGLDNLDEIIAASDGIILAREFLAEFLVKPNQLISIQMYISAKCKQQGKPFYLSGNVLEDHLQLGIISCRELNDVTNAVMQGAGFVLKSYADATSLLDSMNHLNSVCKLVETMTQQDEMSFWRLCLDLPPPVTAVDASILACAITARQSGSVAVVVLTVTGKTAVQLARLSPDAIILSVSADPRVSRQLQLYRGIIPITYDQKSVKDWYGNINARVEFAVSYGLTHDLLKYSQMYVVLRKGSPSSAYCDHVSLWKVVVEETKKKGLDCPEHASDPVRHYHSRLRKK